MKEDKILREFQRVPLNEYLRQCRLYGRKEVPEPMRDDACKLYALVTEWMTTTRPMSWEIRRALELADDFLWAENFLRTQPEPRYIAYTNLRILDRFILHGQQVPLRSSLDRCKTAIAILVRDWRDYEAHALTLFPRYDALNFSSDAVRERLAGLDELMKLTVRRALPDVHPIESMPTHMFRSDWIYYAVELGGALSLCHLTGLPQSRYHDEYMFLRTIHISECCFHAINLSVRGAVSAVHRSQLDKATAALTEANFFASFLVKLFAIFPTMLIDSFFNGFRPLTGNASAIQSEKYQLLEKLTRGLNDQKNNALRRQPESKVFADWSLPEECTLAGILRNVGDIDAEAAKDLSSAIMEIDRHLLMWRSKHLGIARKYLPPEAKGTGDEGVSYLESNVRDPKISSGTTIADTVDSERFRLTAALQIAALGTTFTWCECSNLDAAKLYEALKSSREETDRCVSRPPEEVQLSIEIYDTFFADRQHKSPLTSQLRSAQSKGIGRNNAVAELLLTCELQSGVLIGIHDLTRVQGPLRLDVAVDGDSYLHIGGRSQRCRTGDWVLRDGKGIVASYFDGPDKRTALDPSSIEQGKTLPSIGVIILGAPNLPITRIRHAEELIDTFIARFAEAATWATWEM